MDIAKLHKMAEHEIANIMYDCRNEMLRRAAINSQTDSGAIIKGQEIAKRVITIAAAGKFSVLFVGPKGVGKTMLRALAADLNVVSFEVWPCPCGYRTSLRIPCKCTVKQIEKHVSRWPKTDMYVECPEVSEREMNSSLTGTSLDMIKDAIANKGDKIPTELDEHAQYILKATVTEFGLDGHSRVRSIEIAKVIARLDRSVVVKAQHISEAINYRFPI